MGASSFQNDRSSLRRDDSSKSEIDPRFVYLRCPRESVLPVFLGYSCH